MKNSAPEMVYLSNVSSVSPTNLMVATRLCIRCAHAACLDYKFKPGCRCVPLSFGTHIRELQHFQIVRLAADWILDNIEWSMAMAGQLSTGSFRVTVVKASGFQLLQVTSIMNHGCLHGIRDHVNVWFLPVCFACMIYVRMLSS
jgi:hypothetical protein